MDYVFTVLLYLPCLSLTEDLQLPGLNYYPCRPWSYQCIDM